MNLYQTKSSQTIFFDYCFKKVNLQMALPQHHIGHQDMPPKGGFPDFKYGF